MSQAIDQTVAEDLPDRFGRYHVIGVAGRGNMSTVYTGYDPQAERDVAIKVCDPRESDPGRLPLIRRLFFNEAKTAGLLDHPKLLKVLDAGEQRGLLYIVMEYVEGGETLAPYCRPDRLLPLAMVGQIVHACADALDYAHRCGVIHRDIKPTNIMITRERLIKIGDFGVAQLASSDQTQVMAVVGSPLYMSPEQAEDRRVDGRTDLYALGVVMFELLTGRPPFRATTLPQLVHKICAQPAPDVREFRPEVPGPVAEILARALRKQPQARFESGREMATALARVFENLSADPVAVPDEDKVRAMRRLRFFADFRPAQIRELLDHSHWGAYSAGEPVPVEGASEMSLFIIVSGRVEILRHRTRIASLEAGQCFGELGYLAGTSQSTDIVAVEDVSLLRISAEVMEGASENCQLQVHKAFTRALLERLSRVQTTTNQAPA